MQKIYTLIIAVLFSFTAFSQIIVIDPGHGYGATVSDNPDGRTAIEIETTLEVGLRTKALIQTSCIWTVQMTRSTNVNGWISVNQRALMANNWNADRLLSIHCNAGGGTGTETFYCTDGDTNTAPDIAFASKIQTDMVSNGQWSNRRCVEDMSFLAYHLGVLKYSSATACLNEIGFVDSADATKLTSSTWRDQFALAYFNAFKSILNLTCNALPAPGTFSLTVTPECNGTTSRNNLTWTASTNATSYDIYRNGILYANNITASPYLNTATAGTTYTYSVKAKNTTGQTSNSNGDVSVTALNCATPGTFTLTVTPECVNSASRLNLTWTASANATVYDIFRNGALYASDIVGTQFLNTYLITPGTVYTYSVKAKNTIGQLTNSNGTLSVTAVGCGPGAFTLSATATCSGFASAINLSWSVSANATSYDIYRNGNLYASDITGTTFLNTYLITAGTSYTYFVKAKNSIGTLNNSNGSIAVTAVSCGKIAAQDENAEITLYPNPTSGIFNLNISNVSDETITYRLFDSTGKVVYESKVESASTSIDINQLPGGIYFISILIGNKEVVKRVVKR
ncbi:N-acetylmuramoyl-L-alanine amidase [Flavobacterium sp. GT3R68]|uniref:N-acetylmuramoyl-L-alanine amidase n=1 Tax=Flavobacterium sp. GT3R68 TaxID=2594437 RepID=UPI000F86BAAA|nr:N-acetylmuramoyl-L-alanine amidase [Flavobacterium sp. GT3R68]RTY95059.1 T9SS type A sorting domain-containing protein [Flavobacterium sp. GSN2]TRW91865.1 T9SS type A sorting domain-containing protein [Flavobacterium sp. GT3R68]